MLAIVYTVLDVAMNLRCCNETVIILFLVVYIVYILFFLIVLNDVSNMLTLINENLFTLLLAYFMLAR